MIFDKMKTSPQLLKTIIVAIILLAVVFFTIFLSPKGGSLVKDIKDIVSLDKNEYQLTIKEKMEITENFTNTGENLTYEEKTEISKNFR